MASKNVLAFDLGASGGRGMLARFDGKRLRLEQIHRFEHSFSILGGHAYWDILRLMDEMKKGLRLCGPGLSGVGFDTWGVDCGFIDAQGFLVGLPLSYRDAALDDGNMRRALLELGGEEYAFERTGIASLAYNTIYKLYYMKEHMTSQLKAADKLLFMPNLIEYLFSGVVHAEYSIASTSQMYDVRNRQWAVDFIEKAGIDADILPKVDFAGTDLGKIRSDVAKETGQEGLRVISVPGHDTACAASSVPAKEKEFAFLSSGTWSLLGITSEKTIEGEAAVRKKISNEGAWNGAYRPVVNIIGLWICQELRRNFASEGREYSFEQMNALAAKAKPLRCFIRPDDFMQPGSYPEKIRAYCKSTGQEIPDGDGELVRCALESLALKYRQTYEEFRPYIDWEEKLYVVGGGVQNGLLNQFTANALNVPVITGASEATAAGNAMAQLKALGEYETDEERSEILLASFKAEKYYPKDVSMWQEAYGRFLKLYE